MNRFVVVTDSSGSLHPDVAALLDSSDIDALPFRPERHVRWSDPSGTVHYAGWERGAEAGADADAGGLVAWAGNPRPRRGAWPTGRPVVDLVREGVDGPGWTPDASFCDAHVVVRLRPDGTGLIASDPIGLHPLYRAEHGPLTAVGNRADLVAAVLARATGRPATRDIAGGAWMAFLGFHLGSITGFEGVEVVAHDAHVEIGRGRVAFPASPTVFDADPECPTPTVEEAVGEVVEAITDALRHSIAWLSRPPRVELTGGKDSRMVMAVALGAGLTDRLQFVTFGEPELPDMLVARAIAERFGLDHVDTTAEHYRAAAGFTTIERYRRHVHRTCGASPCSDANEPPSGTDLVVSGHLGELFRTANTPLAESPPADWRAATRRLVASRQPGRARLVRPEHGAPMRAQLRTFMVEAVDRLHRPVDLTHAFNVRCRYPRWQGPLVDHHEHRVLPLCSPDALRAAFAVGDARDAEALHHRIIHDVSPELAALPFANDKWRGESAVSEPVHGPATVRQVPRPEAAHQSVLRDVLRGRPENPAFEVLDQDAIAAGIDRLVELSPLERMQLLGAVTALIWHGDTTSPSRSA